MTSVEDKIGERFAGIVSGLDEKIKSFPALLDYLDLYNYSDESISFRSAREALNILSPEATEVNDKPFTLEEVQRHIAGERGYAFGLILLLVKGLEIDIQVFLIERQPIGSIASEAPFLTDEAVIVFLKKHINNEETFTPNPRNSSLSIIHYALLFADENPKHCKTVTDIILNSYNKALLSLVVSTSRNPEAIDEALIRLKKAGGEVIHENLFSNRKALHESLRREWEELLKNSSDVQDHQIDGIIYAAKTREDFPTDLSGKIFDYVASRIRSGNGRVTELDILSSKTFPTQKKTEHIIQLFNHLSSNRQGDFLSYAIDSLMRKHETLPPELETYMLHSPAMKPYLSRVVTGRQLSDISTLSFLNSPAAMEASDHPYLSLGSRLNAGDLEELLFSFLTVNENWEQYDLFRNEDRLRKVLIHGLQEEATPAELKKLPTSYIKKLAEMVSSSRLAEIEEERNMHTAWSAGEQVPDRHREWFEYLSKASHSSLTVEDYKKFMGSLGWKKTRQIVASSDFPEQLFRTALYHESEEVSSWFAAGSANIQPDLIEEYLTLHLSDSPEETPRTKHSTAISLLKRVLSGRAGRTARLDELIDRMVTPDDEEALTAVLFSDRAGKHLPEALKHYRESQKIPVTVMQALTELQLNLDEEPILNLYLHLDDYGLDETQKKEFLSRFFLRGFSKEAIAAVLKKAAENYSDDDIYFWGVEDGNGGVLNLLARASFDQSENVDSLVTFLHKTSYPNFMAKLFASALDSPPPENLALEMIKTEHSEEKPHPHTVELAISFGGMDGSVMDVLARNLLLPEVLHDLYLTESIKEAKPESLIALLNTEVGLTVEHRDNIVYELLRRGELSRLMWEEPVERSEVLKRATKQILSEMYDDRAEILNTWSVVSLVNEGALSPIDSV